MHSFWATFHYLSLNSNYELKLSIQVDFDTLISNQKLNFQYYFFNIIILKKSVEWQALSTEIHISIDTVSQIIIFLVHVTSIA